MKRALCVMLAVMMLFSLVACGGSPTVTEDNESEGDTTVSLDTSGGVSDNTTSDNSRTTGMSDATRELLDSINVDNAEAMGFCGADITWYYLNNVLVLKGTGRMTDFSSGDGRFVGGSGAVRPYEDVLPSVSRVIIDDGITYVSKFAFYWGTGIAAVYLPNTLEEIGSHAFHGCTALASITIPDSVTSIGAQAFSSCKGLTSITIPNSITYIDEYTFLRCTGLTSITIPNSVTSIGEHAFSHCSGLTSITIPDSVTSIGEGIFNDCTGLTIYYSSSAVDEIVSEYPEFNWLKQ